MNVQHVDMTWLEIFGFAIAPLIAVGIVATARTKRSTDAPTGSASRTTASVGANTALGAALVSGLFAVTGLSQSAHYSTRPAYGVMIAFFAAIIALAAPVANIATNEGPARLFTTGTFVLWGAIGQFVITFLLTLELYRGELISIITTGILALLDLVLGIGVVVYVWRAVHTPQKQLAQDRAETVAAARTAQNWSIP